MPQITVYSGTPCPFCERAKMLLKKKGAAFDEYDVRADSDKMAEMLAKTGGKRTIPQIFIGGKHIGGCDELYAMEQAGKLDALLAG